MEWKEVNICQMCDTISDTYKGTAEEVVLINTSDVLDGKCLNHEYVENKNLRGQFKKTFRKDDILYSEIRPANKRFCYVDFEPKDYIASTKLMVLRHHDNVNPHFLYQVLRSTDTLLQLQTLAESRSGTFPQITYSELANIIIKLPSKREQDRIVSILSSLDRKIELNNKINAQLEEMAQAIFKSWFVDFEPFKDGKFVDSELGLIPEGWRVGKVEDFAQIMASGGTPKSTNNSYYEGNIKWYSTKELKDCFLIDSEKHISQEAYENSATKLFPAETVLMAIYAAPTVGRLGILCTEGCFNQAAVGIYPKDEIGSDFVYLYLLSERNNLNNLACGAAQQNLNVKLVKDYPALLPPCDILLNFNKIVKPIREKSKSLQKENQTLATLRDTLLPKLMSGEIEI